MGDRSQLSAADDDDGDDDEARRQAGRPAGRQAGSATKKHDTKKHDGMSVDTKKHDGMSSHAQPTENTCDLKVAPYQETRNTEIPSSTIAQYQETR